MVKLLYNYNKKDFMRLYIDRSYRSLDDNFSRMVLLFLSVIFSIESLIMYELLIYDGNEKISYHDIYQVFAQAVFILVMLLFAIFFLAYQRAAYCWARRQLLREKACYIRTMSFDIDCLIVDCVVLNKRIIKKIFYQDLSAAKIYKNGLFLSIKGSLPLYVCKSLFDTEEEYETVCKWIKADKKFKN